MSCPLSVYWSSMYSSLPCGKFLFAVYIIENACPACQQKFFLSWENFFLTFSILKSSIYNGTHEHVYIAYLPQVKISAFQKRKMRAIMGMSKGEKIMYWYVIVYRSYQYMDYEHKIHTERSPVFTLDFETSCEAEEFAAEMRQRGYQTAIRLG